MGCQPLLIVLALATALAAPLSADVPTCESLDLVRGASRPAVRGVVERTRVVSNPLPWGASISAVTRVWGGVVVERWATSGEIRPCLVPADAPTYQAVGIEEVLVPAAGEISGLELGALTAQFGPPVVYEPSGFDRAMAWLRVFPSIPIVLVLVGWSVVSIRRRRHRPDPYLF
ncbi:MAG: hypothetical protein ACLGHX_00695 [Acidimicrobiia bacterium]